MGKTHGKYGPPPPGRGHPSTMEPPPQLYRSGSGGRGGGGYGGDRRGGNRHNDGYRGGRGDRRGGPGPGRWERNGGGGGGYDRGYDNRREDDRISAIATVEVVVTGVEGANEKAFAVLLAPTMQI